MSENSSVNPVRHRFGLAPMVIVGLALLAAPRVVLHDLGIIHERTGVNALLVFLPAVAWIVVAVVRRVPNPFLTLLAVGACYGVILVIGHQVLWDVGGAPELGGRLAAWDPTVRTVVARGFAAVSSLFTGLITGAVTGLVAWGLAHLARRGEQR